MPVSLTCEIFPERRTNAPNLARIHGNLVAEFVSYGNINFQINDVDFDIEGLAILEFAIDFYSNIAEVLATGGKHVHQFLDIDGSFLIKAEKGDQITVAIASFDGEELHNEAQIDGLSLLRDSSQFLKEVLRQSFEYYPALLSNWSFLSFCPFAFEVGSGAVDRSKMVWYPTDIEPDVPGSKNFSTRTRDTMTR